MPYSATANNITNSWTRYAHPARRPKVRSFKKPKKITLGKEETDIMIQNHITKHEFQDQSVVRVNLFQSEMLGNTKRNRDKYVNELHNFCLLTQDWGSIILFSLAFNTQNFLSMHAQTLALCLDFKHNNLVSELIGLEGNTVKECIGNPVLWEGSWNDPGNREQSLSAVSKLHSNHAQVCDHVPACKECIKSVFTLETEKACSTHDHVLLLKNNGNPRHSPTIANANKKHSRPSYVAESDSLMAPLELKLLYNFCIDSNNVYKL